MDAHHAIIPTAKAVSVKLTEHEANIYQLIARQYIIQFMSDAVYRKCTIELDIEKGKFIAKARFLAEAGWRVVLGSKERDAENDGSPLPVVAKGMSYCVKKAKCLKNKRNPQGLLRMRHYYPR